MTELGSRERTCLGHRGNTPMRIRIAAECRLDISLCNRFDIHYNTGYLTRAIDICIECTLFRTVYSTFGIHLRIDGCSVFNKYRPFAVILVTIRNCTLRLVDSQEISCLGHLGVINRVIQCTLTVLSSIHILSVDNHVGNQLTGNGSATYFITVRS